MGFSLIGLEIGFIIIIEPSKWCHLIPLGISTLVVLRSKDKEEFTGQ